MSGKEKPSFQQEVGLGASVLPSPTVATGLCCQPCWNGSDSKKRKRRYTDVSALFTHCKTVHKDFSYLKDMIKVVGDEVESKFKLPSMESIIYDDDFMAVVSKAQGAETSRINIDMGYILHFLKRADKTVVEKSSKNKDRIYELPRAAHRLDKPTGGLVIIAKTKNVLSTITQSFKDHKVKKVYRAIVVGKLKCPKENTNVFTISEPVGGKSAHTECTILSYHSYEYISKVETKSEEKDMDESEDRMHGESSKKPKLSCNSEGGEKKITVTKVELRPATGRTHQLRKHMRTLGHPILGDKRYGFSDAEALHLWALKLKFPHPISEEIINVSIEEPGYYKLPTFDPK